MAAEKIVGREPLGGMFVLFPDSKKGDAGDKVMSPTLPPLPFALSPRHLLPAAPSFRHPLPPLPSLLYRLPPPFLPASASSSPPRSSWS